MDPDQYSDSQISEESDHVEGKEQDKKHHLWFHSGGEAQENKFRCKRLVFSSHSEHFIYAVLLLSVLH